MAASDTYTLKSILDQRGKEYGAFDQMCNKIQEIKRAFVTPRRLPDIHQEALDLIATKIGRILTGNPDNEDSWRDIAGYATLVADRVKPKKNKSVVMPGGLMPTTMDENGRLVTMASGVAIVPSGGFSYTGPNDWPYKVWFPDVRRANDFANSINKKELYDV